jgi:tRNA (guanine10-N2)-dimethyltransferase
MKLLFELSQEHPELPKAEALACLDAEGIKYNVSDDKIKGLLDLGIELNPDDTVFNSLLNRIALCFSLTHELYSAKGFSQLQEYINDFKLKPGDTFCVTAKRAGNFHPDLVLPELERKIGAIISKEYQVDLDNPDQEIKIIVAEKFHFGINIGNINRKSFETRLPQNRPYFSPVSLHPKFARTLVNLARIRAGDLVLDPFCGTGGIMIEAGLIGLEIVGCDIDENMVNGCIKNLEWAGLKNYSIFQSDIGELNEIVDDPSRIDAIVTEPPYGRAATTAGESLETLYERAFESFHEILPQKKFLVISVPDKKLIKFSEKYFKLAEIYSMRIHKSLVKHFCVLVNN